MNKLKELLKNNEEAFKELEKLDKKLADILFLLYDLEDKFNYEVKEISDAIDLLQNI